MLPKQKTFLDELAALFKKYNIDSVRSERDFIRIDSDGMNLSFRDYYITYQGGSMFEDVVSTHDYCPEDSAFEYSGEENFDD